MKTNLIYRALRAVSFSLVGTLLLACVEKEIDNPEPNDPTGTTDLTPNEVKKQLDFVSENLLSITLDYSPEKEKDLDRIIETIKQSGVVKEVIRGDNYIEVIDQDDFSICYPFILPPLFESDDNSGAYLSSLVDFSVGLPENTPETRASSAGGAVVFNFYTEDETRQNQNSMMKAAANNLHNLSGLGSLENIYRKKSEFTGDNLYREIHNSSNKVIIVSSHGFDNCIVTGESVTAASFSGWSRKEKKEAMSQNRLVDVGDKDKNGNRLYNKVWRVTDGLVDGEYMGEKLIYFTGCNVMSPGVVEALKNVNGIVVGWDGKNSLGEAVGLIMADCLSRMSFKQFYRIAGISIDDVTPGINSAHLVYTGKSADFSLKKINSNTFNSRITRPQNDYSKVKFMMGSRYIDVGFIIEENDFINKDGSVYLLNELNPSNNTTWTNSETYVDMLFPDWWQEWGDFWSRLLRANQCRGYYLKQPGVYKIYLCRDDGHHKIEDFFDVKYVLYSSKFQTNYVEAIEMPAPTVGTVVKETNNDITLFGAQSNSFGENNEYGFSIWVKGNETNPVSIKASLYEGSTQVFYASASSLSKATYQAKAYVKDDKGNTYYGNEVEFSVANSVIPSEPTPGDLIDLGLSVKWASCNLGASKPEEYGDYYAWGEIEPYYSSQDPYFWKDGKESGYYWPSYKWCKGNSNTLTKYCYNSAYGYNGFTDGKTVLDPEDDASYVNLGGNWRMPTVDEWMELMDNCTWTWITQNGVMGYLVTSSNGNNIFLPPVGFRDHIYINFDGSEGYYWSSSLDTVSPYYAKFIEFEDSYISRGAVCPRYRGYSVRPVCDDK